MAKAKKGVKKFQKKIAAGGVHKKKKLHFKRDKAEAAKAVAPVEPSAQSKGKPGKLRKCNFLPIEVSAAKTCSTLL